MKGKARANAMEAKIIPLKSRANPGTGTAQKLDQRARATASFAPTFPLFPTCSAASTVKLPN